MTDRLPVHSVVVSREDDLWVAVVEGLPGGATDVEHFRDLPDAVRDLIATLLGVDADSFWIDWHYRQGGHELTRVIQDLRQWEWLAERATRHRDAARRAAVEGLRAAGLTYREIADVVRMSHQRVWQLLDAAEKDQGVACAKKSSPFEVLLGALLDVARRVRPEFRPKLLSTTASVLNEAAEDEEFLRSGARP